MKHLIQFNEHKLWFKTIDQFLTWMEEKSSEDCFLFLDTETTGIPKRDKVPIQLTQISAISTDYNFNSNKFHEISNFNKKIKLTQETKDLMKKGLGKISWVLGFNHYGESGTKYEEENKTIGEFYNWIKISGKKIIIVAQNATFDMEMINVRNPVINFDNEVLDTKMILQLFYLPALQKLSEKDDIYKNMVSKIGTSDRDNGLISSAMGKVGPVLGLDMSNYHDALTDCRITIEMVKKIVDFLKEHRELDISKYQLERIKLIKQNK